MSDDTELTSEEKMAFDSLPREATPSDLLEERIVRALREEGTLRRASGIRGADLRSGHTSRWSRPWIAAAASMAASLILFGSGVATGHWMAARTAERMLLAVRAQDHTLVAERVQEAGSSYVRALAALHALRESRDTGAPDGRALPATRVAAEIQQGGEAALGTLYAAALELARLDPDDPDVADILQILEGRRFARDRQGSGAVTSLWY